MGYLNKLKGALEKMAKALAPQKAYSISILGKQKYGTGAKRVITSSKSSILGMAKYNQDSGVGRNVQQSSRQEK